MLPFYNLFIRLYHLLIFLASPFVPKASLWLKGRKGLFKRLEQLNHPGKKKIWIHCASLGEFEQGRPLIEAFREMHPEYAIFLTFFSPSGFEVRKNYDKADHVFYLPLDTAANAKRFIQLVKPHAAFFIKYEFWYHYLTELKKQNIPVYLVSAIFRPDQAFFRPYGGFFRKMLRCYKMIFVQDRRSEELLNNIGIDTAILNGDTRFDRVSDLAGKAKDIPLLSTLRTKKRVLIAGSTWPRDEELLAAWLHEKHPDFKIIIAPHEIESSSLDRTRSLFSKEGAFKVFFYSELRDEEASEANIIIIDSIGLLSSLYRYGDIAYVGGGFGKGIHNILEPAAFGLPVFFGPAYHKFREACDLVENKAAFPINNSNDFSSRLQELVSNEEKLHTLRNKIKEYVKSHKGATLNIIRKIEL